MRYMAIKRSHGKKAGSKKADETDGSSCDQVSYALFFEDLVDHACKKRRLKSPESCGLNLTCAKALPIQLDS